MVSGRLTTFNKIDEFARKISTDRYLDGKFFLQALQTVSDFSSKHNKITNTVKYRVSGEWNDANTSDLDIIEND